MKTFMVITQEILVFKTTVQANTQEEAERLSLDGQGQRSYEILEQEVVESYELTNKKKGE